MSKKINPKSVIASGKTSIMIFLLAFVILSAYIIFGLKNPNISDFLSFLVIFLLAFIPSFLNFYQKEIYLTGNSIHIYVRGKKIHSFSILEDLKALDIRQDKLGKTLNYGTLIIDTKQYGVVTYMFLSEPEKMLDSIMYRYEYLMKKNDPSFVQTYKKNKEETKKLDTIEETNEK
jgi:hypothetical protein